MTAACMPSSPSPVLAAALIVRNEVRSIARCLESVRPWVDRMVVLDTGSSDDTIALARRCGAEVHQAAWPHDFSAARNRVLDLTDADWNLVIDADEWIVSGGALLRSWCLGPARLGTICQHSASDAAPSPVAGAPLPSSRNWVTRLLPREVRYRGRVHEQAVSALPRERIELHLGHDGYLETQLAPKRERNRPLLLLELREKPDNPYILFQLGKEAEARDQHAKAAALYARAFARTPPHANWRHELLIGYLHCLGRSGRADAGLEIAEREMPHWSHSPDFFFVLGNLLLERAIADPGQAVHHWLPLACAGWERCLKIGERPDLEGSIQGRGSHLARYNLELVRSQIALLAR